MLGKVAPKGVFVLDRPLTIIEAVARAHGLETGLFESTTVEVADVQEVYVLGEVKNPGAYAYLADATALASLSARGGCTEKA